MSDEPKIPGLYTLEDLLAQPDERADWGPWHLDGVFLVLDRSVTGYEYTVDLLACRTSAQALDWIAQVAGKGWASDRVIAGLVRALDQVLYPQQNLCPRGESRELGPADVRDLVVAAQGLVDAPQNRHQRAAAAPTGGWEGEDAPGPVQANSGRNADGEPPTPGRRS